MSLLVLPRKRVGSTDTVVLSFSPRLYLDFGDPTQLFTDEGGSTPVTTNGDLIKLAKDKSANANHWSAPVDKLPSYLTNQQNGLSAAGFDGSGKYLTGGVGAESGATGFHMFWIYRLAADPPSGSQIGHLRLSSASGVSHHPYSSGVFYDASGASSRQTTVDPTPSLTTTRIYEVRSTGSSWISRLDGSDLYSYSGGAIYAWPSETCYLGVNGGGQTMNGQCMALVVYASALSTGDAATVRDALKSRWGTS